MILNNCDINAGCVFFPSDFFSVTNKFRMVCHRIAAFQRIGSTIAHKSKAFYLVRPSYVRFHNE